jgi:fatty-acid desaturase
MENEKQPYFEEVKDLAASYIEDQLVLLQLDTAEKVAQASSSIFKIAVLAMLLFFIFMILTFLAGYYLSDVMGSIFLGFGTLVIVYVILVFVLLITHKKFLDKIIVDKVIKGFFNTK